MKFASIIGSYGWSTKVVDQLAGMIPNLMLEILDTVLCKGFPGEAGFQALGKLAADIASKHEQLQLEN